MATPNNCRVLVKKAGRLSYCKALALQKLLAAQYKKQEGEVAGELILCEHDPVFTFGLRESNFQAKAAELEKLGCEVHKVRRGGLTTFHGPGQLVCYPILNLRQLKVGIKDYVRCLEAAIIATLSEYGIEGYTTENTGVWVNHPSKGESKLCSIGIQVSHGVTCHGLALNCNTELSWFKHITPCGVEGKAVTSLTELFAAGAVDSPRGTVTPDMVAPPLVQALANTIGFQIER